MDLTDVSFITHLSGSADSPCMSHTIGYFPSTEAAEKALTNSWIELHKEHDYSTFTIEEVIVGKILKNDTGTSIVKCFTVRNNKLEVDE